MPHTARNIQAKPKPPIPLLPLLLEGEDPPLRYPEVLGTLIERRESIRDGISRGSGLFVVPEAQMIQAGTPILFEAPIVVVSPEVCNYRSSRDSDPLDKLIESLDYKKAPMYKDLWLWGCPFKDIGDNRKRMSCNGFSVKISENEPDSTALFQMSCVINHECNPNCLWSWEKTDEKDGGRLLVWACKDIGAGEELSISYGHHRKKLKRVYGFDYNSKDTCEKCKAGLEDSDDEGGGKVDVSGMEERHPDLEFADRFLEGLGRFQSAL